MGDTDQPVIRGADGQTLTIDDRFLAEVAFHQQDATRTLADNRSKADLCHLHGHRGDAAYFGVHGFVDSASEATICRNSGGNVISVSLNGALSGHLKH